MYEANERSKLRKDFVEKGTNPLAGKTAGRVVYFLEVQPRHAMQNEVTDYTLPERRAKVAYLPVLHCRAQQFGGNLP